MQQIPGVHLGFHLGWDQILDCRRVGLTHVTWLSTGAAIWLFIDFLYCKALIVCTIVQFKTVSPSFQRFALTVAINIYSINIHRGASYCRNMNFNRMCQDGNRISLLRILLIVSWQEHSKKNTRNQQQLVYWKIYA